jgi:L-rhamnose mutarotase
MQRICFTLRVRPDRLEEYKERHRAVWPEMLGALRNAGWRNYSLFVRDDGLLIGYVETEDFQAARAAMSRTEVNARWQAEMKEFFVSDSDLTPDKQMQPIPEVFHGLGGGRVSPPLNPG